MRRRWSGRRRGRRDEVVIATKCGLVRDDPAQGRVTSRLTAAEFLPCCAAHEIGVVAYGPLAHGLLTGRFTRARLADLPEGDWRRQGARFQEPELSANLAFVEGLRRIAEGEGCSLAGLAIAWVLRRPEIAAAIVGARSPAQIAETVKNVDQALSAEVLGEIERSLGEREGLCRERRPVEGP